MDDFTLIKGYKDNNSLRKSFNELAKKTFELSFEDWYQNGYWKDSYLPYSIIKAGKVISNVSASIMEFDFNRNKKIFIQIGTVMTEKAYRNKGFIRRLIMEIEKDYKDVADGFFLFANDSVLNFYPKFGFKKALEYQYSKSVYINQEKCIIQLPMKDKSDWILLERAIKCSVSNSCFEDKDNIGLGMFYITKFMQENVYYLQEQNIYVIAEIANDNLLIHRIFSKKIVNLEEVIKAFGKEIKNVSLGFTPLIKEGYSISEVFEEDTTLFVKGKTFADFEENKLMFPTLSHA